MNCDYVDCDSCKHSKYVGWHDVDETDELIECGEFVCGLEALPKHGHTGRCIGFEKLPNEPTHER